MGNYKWTQRCMKISTNRNYEPGLSYRASLRAPQRMEARTVVGLSNRSGAKPEPFTAVTAGIAAFRSAFSFWPLSKSTAAHPSARDARRMDGKDCEKRTVRLENEQHAGKLFNVLHRTLFSPGSALGYGITVNQSVKIYSRPEVGRAGMVSQGASGMKATPNWDDWDEMGRG
jgi:hypothetical protein